MKVKARVKTSLCPICGGEVNVKEIRSFRVMFCFFKCKKCGATIRERIILKGGQNEQR